MKFINYTQVHSKQRGSIFFLFALITYSVSIPYGSAANTTSPVVSQTNGDQNISSNRRIQTADARQLGVGQDIGFVEQLVHQSAAAKQILESDNAEAKVLREQAIKHLEDAKLEQAKGNNQAVSEALGKAKVTIFQAIRLSGNKTAKNKHTLDFKKRVQSTKVLLEAHKRVSEEKGSDIAAKKVAQHVENELQKAQNAFDQGRTDDALKLANAAYLSIKLHVTRLRDGDTLVRALHFETKEDEYNYELERNNTHKVLVNVVLKEKLSPQMSMLIKIPMNKAEELRQDAIKQAAEKDYETAIKTLEEATQQIIRAIRMAGIYIPG